MAGDLLPGQVKKETEKSLTFQSPPSQKSTETCHCNTAQLVFSFYLGE